MNLDMPFEQPLTELRSKIEELKRFGKEKEIDFVDEIAKLELRYTKLEEEIYGGLIPSQIMQLARHAMRPTTIDYIQNLFTDFIELHGDRMFGDDLAIIGGVAKFNGIPVTVVGHQKGKDTKDNIARFFGMPHPEGYRKALRLMKQADKFKRPIITFIDVIGAYPGDTAEMRGVSESIARNLMEMSSFRVPIICIVTGQGGSGGALAIAVGNRVLMLENAIYSVASPESAASIIFKDAAEVNKTAESMKITSKDMLELEVVEEIIPEPKGGAHRNPEAQYEYVREAIQRNLDSLMQMSGEELREERYNRFRKLGKVNNMQQVT